MHPGTDSNVFSGSDCGLENGPGAEMEIEQNVREGLRKIGADEVIDIVEIASVWKGYGKVFRVYLENYEVDSAVVKVTYGVRDQNFSESHYRKQLSYKVETVWYQALGTAEFGFRTPRYLGNFKGSGYSGLVLEDLDTAGFVGTDGVTDVQTKFSLQWLQAFHSTFLGQSYEWVWERGGYWHLDTRKTELAQMPEGPWKDNARQFDLALSRSIPLTLLHGDAKVSNFCWNGSQAAAFDFQYVGKGAGIVDVMLFLRRVLGENPESGKVEDWLQFYCDCWLRESRTSLPWLKSWIDLFPIAWADYDRFRLGWSPRAKVSAFGQQQLQKGLILLGKSEYGE